MAFLIDTCVWIDVECGSLSPADVAAITGEHPVYLSPVTIAELATDPSVREQRRAALRRLRRKPLLPIDGETGEVFGQVCASLKTFGRSHRYRVQDLWLASQCIQQGFRLLTRNRKDFDDVPGLDRVVI